MEMKDNKKLKNMGSIITTKRRCRITKCSLFSIQGSFSVNRKDLRASTLVGLTQENPATDP